MPSHLLKLRVGTPIIVSQNIAREIGNETQLIIDAFTPYIITIEVLISIEVGKKVFISQINLESMNVELPFKLRQRRFPIKWEKGCFPRGAFLMTINKSQGQTVHILELYLPKPTFFHRQLYVALLHVKSKHGIIQLSNNTKLFKYTKNIIYGEIFERWHLRQWNLDICFLTDAQQGPQG